MKTVSIFGGTGFIGTELVDHLTKKNITSAWLAQGTRDGLFQDQGHDW